jgi:hypothetical protein
LATRRYLTQNIEMLSADDWIASKDQRCPFAAPALRKVEEVFIRKVDALQILTLRSSNGQLHTIHTTREHPFYIDAEGWLRSAILRTGDEVIEADGSVSTVIDSRWESRPEGILVYNLRIAEFHTYFIRAEGSTAEPVWVHNYDSAAIPRLEQEALLEENGMKISSPSENTGINNPYGSRGDPIHQATVDYLEDRAQQEFPNDIVHRETELPPGSKVKRTPDVWVEEAGTGKILKVYEAARYKNGALVSRELIKLKQYQAARIPYHFEPVP